MGAWLQSILQGAGRAGSELNEAKTANREEAQKLAQWKTQQQEIQQRLQTGQAPQVVHTYKGADGKVHNIVRNPLDGKLTDQAVDGPGEMSAEQQKLGDAEKALGRPLSPEEKKILVGVESKTPKAPYSAVRPDAKGKMWGLSAETKQWEPLPEIPGTSFKAPTKGPVGVDPIIRAQIGSPPDASVYPQGEDDPIYKAKAKLWGTQAEAIKNRMVAQRGIGYNISKIGMWVDDEGTMHPAMAGEGLKNGWTMAAQAFNVMPREAQINEMLNASGHLRTAITALQPGDAFTPDQVVKLKLAAGTGDPSLFKSVVDNMASGTLNERQQDYLVWLSQMGERVLSLRNVAGMGQGAQDLRTAIQATLPNISSGNKEFALKRLDAVDNQINLLHPGIPKMPPAKSGGSTGATTPPPGAKIIKWDDVK